MSKNKKKNNNRKKNDMNRKTLFWVFMFIVVYTFAEIIIGVVGMKFGVESPFDGSLISEVFSFAKLMLVSGAAITVKNKVKK